MDSSLRGSLPTEDTARLAPPVGQVAVSSCLVVLPEKPQLEERIDEFVLALIAIDDLDLNEPVQSLLN